MIRKENDDMVSEVLSSNLMSGSGGYVPHRDGVTYSRDFYDRMLKLKILTDKDV